MFTCVKILIAHVSGDNLGSQEIGGFKIGPGARHKCRECMGLPEDIETKVKMHIPAEKQ